MFYVYILRSKKIHDKTYIGYTTNLKERLKLHNLQMVKSTKPFVPWKIETYIGFSNKELAIKFEKYLKIGSGKAFLKKRLINEE